MRIGPLKTYVMVLAGDDPRSRTVSDNEKCRAVEELRKMTGQDFGFDAEKWDRWLKDNKPQDYF